MKYVLLMITFLSGCGIKLTHKVEGTPTTKSTIDLGFQDASDFCASRYGFKTPEAEDCFMDYRHFADINVTFDFSGIIDFCKEAYVEDLDAEQDCRDDLINLMKTITPVK